MDAMIRDVPAHRAVPADESGVSAGQSGAPVFVDATGRRRRLARRIGLAAGAVLVVFLGALGVGAATGAAVPMTPWDGPSAHPRVGGHPSTAARAAKGGSAGGRQGAKPGQRPEAAPSGAGAPSATSRRGATTAPAPSAPSAKPTATASASRPGNSHASPPAWGRKKKSG
ncbi:hypothetical protein [Actinomadura opuntiae]|uniref:hypothetical protein n=1 Tax=Actinomadura sp. OS1-43 TaxID=604315 RepID=UPI00255B254A|nr:hypothetical protein [Actinomadura sp. OS1-43]MDL4816807.1 hypothetical protein [Actinomadura sp. OS1-43]